MKNLNLNRKLNKKLIVEIGENRKIIIFPAQ